MTTEQNLEKRVADSPYASQQIEIKFGQAKGRYNVHPVASLFPLLTGERYEELKKSIQNDGQQEAIIIDGQTILDGRNRLLILNDLGREPKLVHFAAVSTELPAGEWIVVQNLQRRHLTDDQVLAIATKLQPYLRREADRQAPGPESEPDCPAGGADASERPHYNQSQGAEKLAIPELPPKSAENPKRKRGRPKGTRSDVEAVAKKTKQSRHKADQMSKLHKESPTLFGAVEKGELSLKEAMRQFEETQPKKSKTERASKPDSAPKAVERAEAWLTQQASKLAEVERVDFWKQIAALAISFAETEDAKHGDGPRTGTT